MSQVALFVSVLLLGKGILGHLNENNGPKPAA